MSQRERASAAKSLGLEIDRIAPSLEQPLSAEVVFLQSTINNMRRDPELTNAPNLISMQASLSRLVLLKSKSINSVDKELLGDLTNTAEGKRHDIALISFSGFYQSIHQMTLDNAFDQYIESLSLEEEKDLDLRAAFTWSKPMLDAYCKEYVQGLKRYILETGEFSLPSMRFEELVRPKEYNHSTDRLFVSIDDNDMDKLVEFLQNEQAKVQAVADQYFTSGPGFQSFYPAQVGRWDTTDVYDWDHNQKGAIFLSMMGGQIDEAEVTEQCHFTDRVDQLTINSMPGVGATGAHYSDQHASI